MYQYTNMIVDMNHTMFYLDNHAVLLEISLLFILADEFLACLYPCHAELIASNKKYMFILFRMAQHWSGVNVLQKYHVVDFNGWQ